MPNVIGVAQSGVTIITLWPDPPVQVAQSGVTIVTQTITPPTQVAQSGVTIVTRWPSPPTQVAQSGVTVILCVLPETPTDLLALPLLGRVQLTWTDNCGFETGYRVERRGAGLTWATIAHLPADSATYDDTSVQAGQTYTYRVLAENGVCASASAEVAVTTLSTHSVGLVRVLIADRFGRLLTEVQADVGPVSWLLNGIGRASIALATSDAKATAEHLEIGNRVLLLFDNGLPPWGGVLDLPRVWGGGQVSVAAYGIERLLNYRVTARSDNFDGQPAGAIFKTLLQREEEQEPLGIRLGEVRNGGRLHYPRYHYKSLWYVLDYSLSRMERCDWRFRPYLENEFLRFQAAFYEQAGADVSGSAALVEGRNVAADSSLTEQGEVVNTHFAVAEGTDWGVERAVIVGQDAQSRARYGLRETGTVYAGVSAPGTLEMHAVNCLRENSSPRRIFGLEVTNAAPGAFADYDLGDRVRCLLPSFGFGGYDGLVRIIGREYDPASGRCTLAVEEPREPAYWVYQDVAEEA